MTVYLIHAERKYHNRCQHYLGYTPGPLDERIAEHTGSVWEPYEHIVMQSNGKPKRGMVKGKGSVIVALFNYSHIPWQVVRTWDADYHVEHQLKRSHHLSRYCPVCKGAT